MRLFHLALVAGLGPILGIHLCWLISLWQGHVEPCIPYIEGCTTVSRTGRHGLAYHLFKLVVLPGAVLIALYWHSIGQALTHTARLRWIVALGVISTLFLALYASFLGSTEDAFVIYRRVGVTAFFGMMFLAELLLLLELRIQGVAARSLRWLTAAVAIQFTLGLVSLPITALVQPNDHLENIIEWHFTLLLFAYLPMSAPLWRNKRWELISSTPV